MTTVLNPSSAPSAVYNRECRTVDALASAGNYYLVNEYVIGSQGTFVATDAVSAGAAPIIRYGQHTIVLVSSASVAGASIVSDGIHINLGGAVASGISLPTNAEIGDVVEIYQVGSNFNSTMLWPDAGETINGGITQSLSFAGGGTALILRKVAATDWKVLSAQ
jgi:hypothetical protein